MKFPPSDLSLLQEIYRRYYGTFAAYTREHPNRKTKAYVEIDIPAIAKHFGVDVDIIFGRLYYYLNDRYSFKSVNGSEVHFFVKQADGVKDGIQFPLLSSVLSTLKEDEGRHRANFRLSLSALAVSIFALFFSIIPPSCTRGSSPQAPVAVDPQPDERQKTPPSPTPVAPLSAHEKPPPGSAGAGA